MSAEPRVRQVDVLVVGAGPAGLAAAARLAVAGAGRVEVLEREAYAGGVPRHCAHGGFGTWTRPLNGLEYARLLTEAALRAGAVVRTGATVLDWAADTGRPALEASGSAPEGASPRTRVREPPTGAWGCRTRGREQTARCPGRRDCFSRS